MDGKTAALAKMLSEISIKLYFYKNRVYLFSSKEKQTPHIAESSNGFDFQSSKYDQKIHKQCLNTEKQEQKKKRQYLEIIASRTGNENLNNLNIEAVFTDKKRNLVIYHFITEKRTIRIRILKFDKSKPDKLLLSPIELVWETPRSWTKKSLTFINLLKVKNKYISYWFVKGIGIFAVNYPHFKLDGKVKIKSSCRLSKIDDNPIISPKNKNHWEAFTTFNPAVVYEAGKVHIFYRAQGYNYISTIGYASSNDGIKIDERLKEPVFGPTPQSFEKNPNYKINDKYVSGGGYGGCEDPRITKIDNRLYMTYVAFDGFNPPRIALTSILLEDFLKKRWLWEKPVLISPPGVVDKSCCILPEKIRGKYVIFHRIFPNILIDFVDHLNFDGTWFLKGEYKIPPRSKEWWDSRKIGAGAPPIKTEDGWLLIYQAVDDKDDSQYKVGAMLLDLNNPSNVLYRSREPILKPEQPYELNGFKAGVVYPCGAVVINNTLFVYYGSADSYVAVATANLKKFVNQLKKDGLSKVYHTQIKGME
ncbi:hypothetical protein COT75_03850 [Candidatus Beckwithbacteria bacterium CG10_big_fil_rev_8_21_14_0_10_34_10]|uniref:Glycosidase n=1 Tax=Candidatus Beckwithbacteria bacterium CG10_big_fil_rev_8_21_14_0_10_34_10 TaxID=1974495 RepID=A0A2H0W8I2_9BACT|nr:MAG: hypothetical protein COT75_03850 [Candidatus Beckwithbacteria bacterium CG10_big_fil_rev_8_21_14_0_10_34_10]